MRKGQRSGGKEEQVREKKENDKREGGKKGKYRQSRAKTVNQSRLRVDNYNLDNPGMSWYQGGCKTWWGRGRESWVN